MEDIVVSQAQARKSSTYTQKSKPTKQWIASRHRRRLLIEHPQPRNKEFPAVVVGIDEHTRNGHNARWDEELPARHYVAVTVTKGSA